MYTPYFLEGGGVGGGEGEEEEEGEGEQEGEREGEEEEEVEQQSTWVFCGDSSSCSRTSVAMLLDGSSGPSTLSLW